MKTVYKFKVIILMLYLTACGSSGGGSAESKTAPVDPSQPAITQPGGGSTDPVLTYYTMVVNETVSQAGHSYPVTVTGHCIVYDSNTYCWDDGWQTNPGLTNYETDFWGLCDNNGTIGECSGGTSTDPVTQPTLWDSNLANMPFPPHTSQQVFSGGIATQVNCTITGSLVDCGDFQIDTAQAPL